MFSISRPDVVDGSIPSEMLFTYVAPPEQLHRVQYIDQESSEAIDLLHDDGVSGLGVHEELLHSGA